MLCTSLQFTCMYEVLYTLEYLYICYSLSKNKKLIGKRVPSMEIRKIEAAKTFWRLKIIIIKHTKRKKKTFLKNKVVSHCIRFRYTFSSNHNIQKRSCGLCFWAPDPLIDRC